jgi:hypothetical protein
VLGIFIALKNLSLSARLEPATLGSRGKHDNNYTTEDDDYITCCFVATDIV